MKARAPISHEADADDQKRGRAQILENARWEWRFEIVRLEKDLGAERAARHWQGARRAQRM